MSDLREIRARNIYNDAAARFPKGIAWPTWDAVDEQVKEAYRRKAEAMMPPSGPWDELLAVLVEPWAVPTLNWLARKFDKLTNWRKR